MNFGYINDRKPEYLTERIWTKLINWREATKEIFTNSNLINSTVGYVNRIRSIVGGSMLTPEAGNFRTGVATAQRVTVKYAYPRQIENKLSSSVESTNALNKMCLWNLSQNSRRAKIRSYLFSDFLLVRPFFNRTARLLLSISLKMKFGFLSPYFSLNVYWSAGGKKWLHSTACCSYIFVGLVFGLQDVSSGWRLIYILS